MSGQRVAELTIHIDGRLSTIRNEIEQHQDENPNGVLVVFK
jgi:hypothetical protein